MFYFDLCNQKNRHGTHLGILSEIDFLLFFSDSKYPGSNIHCPQYYRDINGFLIDFPNKLVENPDILDFLQVDGLRF